MVNKSGFNVLESIINNMEMFHNGYDSVIE